MSTDIDKLLERLEIRQVCAQEGDCIEWVPDRMCLEAAETIRELRKQCEAMAKGCEGLIAFADGREKPAPLTPMPVTLLPPTTPLLGRRGDARV